jgi:hypothetical protein
MAITNGYVSLSEVKAALRINDTQDDDLLELSIEAASREIDGYCERVFYNAGTATRLYIPTDNFTVEIDDLITLTQLRTSSTGESFDTTWNLSKDVQLEPLNGVAGGLTQPYTRIRAIGNYLFPIWDPRNVNAHEATVQVTGVYGWVNTPKAIKQATLLLSLRQFKRYDSPLGVAGFGDIGVVRVGRFDPDVESLVAPYRKVRMA